LVTAIIAGDTERAAEAAAEHVREAAMTYAHESSDPRPDRHIR